jgi:hypothetical protein
MFIKKSFLSRTKEPMMFTVVGCDVHGLFIRLFEQELATVSHIQYHPQSHISDPTASCGTLPASSVCQRRGAYDS